MPFEDLLSPAMIQDALAATSPLPPRPDTPALYGITMKGKVYKLKPMTKREWEHFDFKKVTGIGWPGWYPVMPADMAVYATRKKGSAKVKPRPVEPIFDDYLMRSSSRRR